MRQAESKELPHIFLFDVASKLENLSNDYSASKVIEILNYCNTIRYSKNTEITVLSTCLIEVFSEIIEYLNYYSEEIEKGFGAKTADEWNRIYNHVISLFIKKSKVKESITSGQKRMEMLSGFIKGWLNFDREDKEKLVRQAKQEQ